MKIHFNEKEDLEDEKIIISIKQFPKDYNGWVYIYCTKTALKKPALTNFEGDILNGKVVARFWCDNVEEIKFYNYDSIYETDNVLDEELKKIVKVDSSWGFKSFYGLTTYWAFANDYCVSMCVHIREVPITYVVTDKNDKLYYTGYGKNEALDAVKKIVEKHK